MARKKGAKPLETHIKELESVVRELHSCAACGKEMGADATTCPHCGTPVGEAAELHEKAEESLIDLEKHLAETTEEPPPKEAASEPSTTGGLESAAAVVAAVEVSALPPSPSVPTLPTPGAEITSGSVQELEPEAEESKDLEGFIEEIEAEVGPGEAHPTAGAREITAPRKPAVRAVHRTVPTPRSTRWVAPIAAGLVLYVLALFLLSLLGRFLVASFMVVGTFLVFAGIAARPVSTAGPGAGTVSTTEEYVCPLCGTEIPARATQCPTCGAIFED